MISTQLATVRKPVSTAVFERMTAATGGKAYFAKTWRDEQRAFASIRDDLAHLYSLSYYPQANPNRGWRGIYREIGRRIAREEVPRFERATDIVLNPIDSPRELRRRPPRKLLRAVNSIRASASALDLNRVATVWP